MATVTEVDPETFVKESKGEPAHGRGAWNRTGIEFDYRPSLEPSEGNFARIGTVCEKSMDHWAVAAGVRSLQLHLQTLGLIDVPAAQLGIFGPKTKDAVMRFQRTGRDPDGDVKLSVDGKFGRTDARALWTPVIDRCEDSHSIPNHFLRGEMYHESGLDAGAIGYYIYYGTAPTYDYRGVDRGIGQINSKFNPQISWLDAFDVPFAADWSARRMRSFYNMFKDNNPKQQDTVLWDAAICAHNNPSAARLWAKNGSAPTGQAASYVNFVKNAVY